MQPITLKAHYDGEHIVLDEPFEIPTDASLEVTVLAPTKSQDGARSEWVAISAHNLARAYGDDEPEYTLADLKR